MSDRDHSMSGTDRELVCPKCGHDGGTVGFAADFDVRCNDCYVLWDIRDGQAISVSSDRTQEPDTKQPEEVDRDV